MGQTRTVSEEHKMLVRANIERAPPSGHERIDLLTYPETGRLYVLGGQHAYAVTGDMVKEADKEGRTPPHVASDVQANKTTCRHTPTDKGDTGWQAQHPAERVRGAQPEAKAAHTCPRRPTPSGVGQWGTGRTDAQQERPSWRQ